MKTIALVMVLGLATAASFTSQQPTFKSGARSVAVYATVTDKGGRLVPDLSRDDFEIRDNGKPQPIAVFSNEVQPISVVMMLDRSGSMQGNFGLVQAAGEAFVRALLPTDRARIGSFAEKIQLDPEHFTSDRAELLGILRRSCRSRGRRRSGTPSKRPSPVFSRRRADVWCSFSPTARIIPATSS